MYEILALCFNDLNIGSNVLWFLILVFMVNVIVSILVYSVIRPFSTHFVMFNLALFEIESITVSAHMMEAER